MKNTLTCNVFINAFNKLGLNPIDSGHLIGPSSRIVHDLGIAGDDFDELAKHLLPSEDRIDFDSKLYQFIPTEISRDAYIVSMARSWIASKCPWIKTYYTNRIKVGPLSVEDFLSLINPPPGVD